MAKIDSSLSEKISVSMFLAIALVVLRHSFNVHIYFPDIHSIGVLDVNSFVQLFMLNITDFAVPFFFIISGYLFFLDYNLSDTLIKWRKRFQSLFIPYVIWNILLILFFIIIQQFSFTSQFSNYEKFEVKLSSILSAIFLDPALGQFWYIRDVIIFIIIAPLLFLIYQKKNLSLLFLVILIILWRPVDTTICSSEGLLFFNIGGYLAYQKSNLKSDLTSTKSLILYFAFWVCLKVILVLGLSLDKNIIEALKKGSIIIGLLFFWDFIDVLMTKKNISILLNLSSYSFFIYAFHSPLIKMLYKVSLSYLPQSQVTGIGAYFLLPMLVIILSVVVAITLKKFIPTIYNVMVGGRSLRH